VKAVRGLCAAVMVSELGDWLLFIALPLYVLHASGSALATSTVFLAELLPAVIVGTVCGPLIDRHSPGRLLTWLTATQAFVVLPLLWAGPNRIWLIYAVAAAQAGFTSLTTPAQQAVVPAVVNAPDLPRANAIIETASSVARLAGSPLGGALLPVVGLRGLVLADIASFLVGGTLLASLRTTPARTMQPTESARPAALIAIVEGSRAIRTSATLSGALIISFLSAVAQGLFLVLFVLFVLRSLHAGDQLVGLLRGVQAIGGVLGGLLVATRLRSSSPRALTVWGLTAFACITVICWNSTLVTLAAWWYVALFIVMGLPATAFSTGFISETQRAGRPHLRGRILSLLVVADALGQATGILAAGVLSGFISLGVLLNVQAGCYLGCAAIAFAVFGKRDAPGTRARTPDRSMPALVEDHPRR
jgi:predicted MFS family arabinose efflux permease